MKVKSRYLSLLVGAVLAALLYPSPTLAATAPPLGQATSFGVLAASAITNTGASVVTGDLGISPNGASSVTGFTFSSPPGPGVVIGTTHFADAVALQAQNDVTTAYNNLAGQACNTTISADLGGMTLIPGVYCSASTMGLTGTVTLDAQSNPNAVFIFQIGSTLTTASNSIVRLINGAQSCNVFWQIGSSATLGTGTQFAGNILALASITVTTGASTNGRALARTGAVTLDSNAVSVCSLAVPTAPTLGKAFSPATINAGGVSTLTITLGNANAAVATLTAPLTDTLPSGVVIAPTPNVGTTCGGVGAPVAAAGGSTVTLPAGRSIPANGSCTLTVDVTAAVAGSYIDTLPAGALMTTNGNNVAPAVATLTVVTLVPPAPPTLGKAFNPATINAGGISTLTITLSNPNAAVATLTAPLTDTLPSGVVIAPTPNVSTTCGGSGAPVAVAGGSTVTLPAGRTIPANGSCTLTVNVTAAVAGSYIDTLLAGALVTTNGNNAAPAVATLTVIPPGPISAPTLSKAFSPATINAGGVSTLTITLSNPNATVATLIGPLTDTLPSGVVIAPTPNVSTTCGGSGAPVAVAGSSTVTLPAGRTIPANGSCTLTVNVTAAVAGSYIDTLPAGALMTSNGNNTAPAVATLIVVPPGSLSQALSAGILFPFITTETGKFSFITILNDGAGGTLNPFTFPFPTSVPRTYHFTYAHKAVPILNTAACDTFDGDALTTPFDMMAFEVSGKVTTNPPSNALFESGVTSTPVILPISGRQGFLIVETLAQDSRCLISEGCIPTLPGAVVPVGGFPGVALSGTAAIIDVASGLFYSYSTGFLVAGGGAAGVPGLVDPQFAFIDESRHFLDWYPDAIVKTSWWVLPLGSRSEMAPAGGGGIRMALVTQPRGIGAAGAFDLDEHVFSGGSATRVRCVGTLDRTNILGSGAKLNTDGGGWTRTIGAVVTVAAATDPNDIQGGTYTRRRHLMLTIQSAPTVLGAPVTTMARTAHTSPLFGRGEIYLDTAPGDANGCQFTFPATQGVPCPDPANPGTGIIGDTIP